MDSDKSNAIIVFARYPVFGKVKTRLAAETNDEFALATYRACAEHTFNEINFIKEKGCDIYIFGSEESELQKIKDWTESKFHYYSQNGNGLGIRMFNAFKKIFIEKYNRVVIVGTDAPDIKSELLEKAFFALNNHDSVIGPANDGGYYLLGFNEKVLDLFSDIEFSTESVLDQTIKKIEALHAGYFLLEELIDIDTKDDLLKWQSNYKGKVNHPLNSILEKNMSELL